MSENKLAWIKLPKAVVYFVLALIIAASALLPLLSINRADAATLADRKVTIDDSRAGGTNTDVSHVFAYNIQTSAAQQGIIYQFCTTPLGTCTLPAGMAVQAATHDSQTGFPTNGTAYTAHTVSDEGDCDMTTTSSKMCFERTQAGAGTGAVTHTISGITNPTSNQTVYIRITLYNDNDFGATDDTDDGVVAAAYVSQLTVNGRVQERLDFCVAGLEDLEPAVSPATVAACAAIGDTNVDLGIIDNSTIATTPVDATATNGADDDFGIAMVNTNASDGVAISYFPGLASSGTNELRSFRVNGATCNVSGTDLFDQCFVSSAAAGAAIVAGTEKFGMHMTCVDTSEGITDNLGSSDGGATRVSGSGTGGTFNTNYSNTDDNIDNSATCESIATDTGVKFAWSASGATAVPLISSTSTVDDEIVKLRFGATASATTPSGQYTVSTVFIATPQF